jgi:hypothetical protein
MGEIDDWQQYARFTVRPSRVLPDIEPVPVTREAVLAQVALLNTMTAAIYSRTKINLNINTRNLRQAG